VAMLDESKESGQAQTLCVFCRMEERKTIWSVVDHILNTDNTEESVPIEEEETVDDGPSVVEEGET